MVRRSAFIALLFAAFGCVVEIPTDDKTLRWLIEQLVELKCREAVQESDASWLQAKKAWGDAYREARKDADKRVANRLGNAARKAAKDGNEVLEKELRDVAKWLAKDDDESEPK